jgi:hypothetical protein
MLEVLCGLTEVQVLSQGQKTYVSKDTDFMPKTKEEEWSLMGEHQQTNQVERML